LVETVKNGFAVQDCASADVFGCCTCSSSEKLDTAQPVSAITATIIYTPSHYPFFAFATPRSTSRKDQLETALPCQPPA